jgi:adenine specific DNA methylase Mod
LIDCQKDGSVFELCKHPQLGCFLINEKISMQLSQSEIRDITRYLEEWKPLPDKYRFYLFEDKKEVELVWNWKTNEVCNTVLPFQVIEQVDEPRKEWWHKIMQSLFDFDDRGRQIKWWTNKLIWGDNKLILSSLKNWPMRDEIEKQGWIKLIYIDPPFDVWADFSMKVEVWNEEFTKNPTVLEEIAYRDTWWKWADSFISMIYERLKIAYDLLAYGWWIYVHCDWRVNWYMRMILDEIFWKDGFRNEIVRKRSNMKWAKVNSNQFGRNHDIIYYYTKWDKFIYNQWFKPYSDEYIKERFSHVDERW